PRRPHGHHRKCNTSNLIYALRSSPTQTRVTTSYSYWDPATPRPAHWIPSHPHCSSLPLISSLINSSLSSGNVPQAFKTARVVPILKKPSLDSSDISSYRPNQLQDINQSGFKPGHSTETALIAVTEKLYAARSAKLSSVLILLDLSVAFDTVNHKILLSFLTDLGITGTAWKWFESYLEDRHSQVAWKGSTSAPCRLSTGVPQGSVVCNRISACLTDISSWMTAHHLKHSQDWTSASLPYGNGEELSCTLSPSRFKYSSSRTTIPEDTWKTSVQTLLCPGSQMSCSSAKDKDRKTKSKQPAAQPVYGKVQKTKKEKAYDDSFIHASNDDGDDLVHKVNESEIHMYLCKDGRGVMMEPLVNKDEYTFTLRKVTVQDSGSYSCVYSINKYPTKNVTASGQNSVYIHVTGIAKTNEQNSECVQLSDDPPDFRPAEIFGPPRVKVGGNIQLKCNSFDKSESSDNLHMYLCKNGVGVMMEPLGKKDDYTFILRNVSVQDSGNYSCVYSLTKYTLKNVSTSGHKTIQVQITDDSEHPQKNVSTNEQNRDPVQLSGPLWIGFRLLVDEIGHTCISMGESLDDMCEYSTIPHLKDVKTKSKQPAGEPVYAKVQKKKKEKAYDDSFMYE
ncbi:hypothetical protein NFI96_017396, partial [Prochilodus magdalenae]